MRFIPLGRHVLCASLLLGCSVTTSELLAQQRDSGNPSYSAQNPPLSVEQVARKLQERNAQRAIALNRFSGTRVYRMEYRGFPGNRDAEMVVRVNFRAPQSKEFTVVSETGSKFIIDHVFKKLLESEQDAGANEENRRHNALTTENYDFTFANYQTDPEGSQYVLNLLPRNNNRYLYRGKIWVDAKDFAVVRIEAEPAKNPSLWIKRTQVEHRYAKVDGFWLPAENRTESLMRLGGKAVLSIEYNDYKIIESAPGHASESSGPRSQASESHR